MGRGRRALVLGLVVAAGSFVATSLAGDSRATKRYLPPATPTPDNQLSAFPASSPPTAGPADRPAPEQPSIGTGASTGVGSRTEADGSSASSIRVAASELSVGIRGAPFGIEARVGGVPIFRGLEGAAQGTLGYRREGSSDWHGLTAVRGVAAIAGGQRLLVDTSEGGAVPARLDVTVAGDGTIRVAFAPPDGGPVSHTGLSVASDPTETLLGLGERFGRLALAGRRVDLWAADRREVGYGDTTYLPVPWLLSSRGYGFLLDETRRSSWDDRAERPDAWSVTVAGPSLAFYLIAGPPARALERYTALTGRPPLPPSWALGVVKTLIGGEPRVLADATRLRGAGIPVDGVFVFDATDGAASVGWPFVTYDPIPRGAYPDLRRLTAALRLLGYHPLAYFSPDLRPGSAAHTDALARGVALRGPDGRPWVNPKYGIGLIDALDPRAVDWWTDGPLRRALVDLGFDGGMLDLGEAVPPDARFADGRTGAEAHNAYPVALAAGMDAALRALKPEGSFWMRAGYTGAQRFHRGTWPGDAVHSWDPATGFGGLVAAALGAGLAGYAYWHAEVGGYVDAGLDPAGERELYLRWLQFGAFTAMLRDNYGDRRGTPTDVWTDDETVGLWRRYARLHRALRPYLLNAARQAASTGLPLLRHLALAYPDDARAWAEERQYLLGDDLLVAPVLEPGARERVVYLPTGPWRHWWTGVGYVGPAEVTVPAPVDQIPIFTRADTVPLGPARPGD